MVLLGDEAEMEARFGPFGDIVSVGARSVHGLHHMYHWLRNHFRRPRWYFEVTRLKWKLVSSPFGDSVNHDKVRFPVCAEHTIGSEIVLDAPDGNPR